MTLCTDLYVSAAFLILPSVFLKSPRTLRALHTEDSNLLSASTYTLSYSQDCNIILKIRTQSVFYFRSVKVKCHPAYADILSVFGKTVGVLIDSLCQLEEFRSLTKGLCKRPESVQEEGKETTSVLHLPESG